MFLEFLEDNYLWGLVLILLINMSQRKIPDSDRKRKATIWLCVLMMLFEFGIITIVSRGWNHQLGWLVLAVCLLLGFLLRRRVWPYRLHCVKCGRRLDWNHFIGHDDNLCQDCWDKAHPEAAKERKEKEAAKKSGYRKPFTCPDTVDAMDWDDWNVTDTCVITYLTDGKKILLIEKKQGLGTGYLNAPGGHVEETETADEAAVREFKEETGLTISGLERRGELFFQFKDGMAEHAYVYFATHWEGTLQECDETRPFWWDDKDDLPYDRMWEDDRLWVPAAMSGHHFKGWFIFDGKTMIDHKVEIDDGSDAE